MSEKTSSKDLVVELPPTISNKDSVDQDVNLKQSHRESISMLYGDFEGELEVNSISTGCPDKSNISTSSTSNRKIAKRQTTINHLANKDVLKGRVDMITKARERSLHNNGSERQDEFKYDYKTSSQSYKPKEKPKCCFQKVRILSPLSIRHTIWDLIVAILLIASLISLPVGMAFDEAGSNMTIMNIIIDFFFIADIIVTFFTGFVDNNDILIMQPKAIAINYLKTWFIMDLIASVPIDLILAIIEAELLKNAATKNMDQTELAYLTKLFKMMRLIRMLKLIRLFRLSRVAKYIRSLRLWLQHHFDFSIPQAFLKISKLVILLVIVAHWLGCIFFMISKQFDFPYNSWVVQSGLIDKPPSSQYLWSILKAFYMIIGGEEMLPSGNGIGCNDVEDYCAAESWMSIVGLYIGVIFSALLISEVTVIITSMDRSRQLYHDKVQEANEYMRANKLSPELREHVREYFSMRYTDQKIFHEQSILEDLSPNLRTQIREEVSHSIIHRVPILRENDQNHAFIDAVVTKLQGPLITFPKEIIFYENTTAHEMYFIFSGVVGILSKAGAGPDDDPEGINVAAISNGCYFGEVALLLNTRRTATARSEVITVLHMLSKQAFIECLDDVPEIKNHMIEVAKKRRQRIVQIDPSYDGEIDETFESSKYVDLEDAKTPLFMYDSAVARKREATERRKSRSAHTSAKFALHFNKKDKHEKQQNKALNRLRRASMQAVTNKHKEMRKKSSDTMSLMSSLGSNKISEEENLKKQQIEEEMGEGDDVLNLEGDDALKLDDLRQT